MSEQEHPGAFLDQLTEVDPRLADWAREALRESDLDTVKARISRAMAVVDASRPDPEHEQLFKDTLTNWCETGMGLWAAARERPERDKDGYVLSVKIEDAEDEGEQHHTVTLDTVKLGFARVRSGEVKALHSSYVANIAGAYAANDGGMIDANDSDIIVQAGLFNEVIYG